MNMASFKELCRADASESAVQYHRYPEGVSASRLVGPISLLEKSLQDSITGVKNTAFCQKKKLQMERTNKRS